MLYCPNCRRAESPPSSDASQPGTGDKAGDKTGEGVASWLILSCRWGVIDNGGLSGNTRLRDVMASPILLSICNPAPPPLPKLSASLFKNPGVSPTNLLPPKKDKC